MKRFLCPLLAGSLLGLCMLCPAAARQTPRVLNGPPGSVNFGTVVRALPNGNIVVTDPDRAGPGNVKQAGAVYLYDVTRLEIIGTLTGTARGRAVENGSVIVSRNGNYVVNSPCWNRSQGPWPERRRDPQGRPHARRRAPRRGLPSPL